MKERWTSTKEARPTEQGEYIVMISEATIPTVLEYYPPSLDFPPDYKDLWIDPLGNTYKVVAWMDLPDPYTEKVE